MIKRLSERFFRWYCNPSYYEDIRGDLNELFDRDLNENPLILAELKFAKEVLLLFRPSIIRPITRWRPNNTREMIRNYFKIGFRNLLKHPSHSLIHVLGLALGLTAFLFIDHYKVFEESYDDFHYAPGQLYRLTTDNVVDGKIQARDAMSFAPSGKALQEDLPEVISHTTTYKTFRMVFSKEERPLEETGVIAVDSNFLNLFRYEVLAGDKATMLSEPYAMVLTESQAKKYFGEEDPIGRSIEVLGPLNQPFRVTGVIRDVPENTHYKFNTLVSLKSFQEILERDGWSNYNYYTYLLLDENADIERLQAKMPEITARYFGREINLVFNLQPVEDIHLHSDFTFEPEIHGSAKAVNFLGIISIFILLIAWVNYINLSTARAVERAKEVGLRKVVGAQKRQLIGQFLVESLLINFFGAVLALMLANLLLPYFNTLVGKTVLTDIWGNPGFLSRLILFFFLGTLITGFYPALVLSSFRPIGILKGNFGRSKQGVLLRKVLVVVQFSASLILITSTVIVYQQVRYMTGKDLGIDIERVIGFQNPGSRGGDYDEYAGAYRAFTEELARVSEVQKVGGISNLPGGGSSDISSSSGGIRVVGKSDRLETTIYGTYMDDRLQETLDLSLLSGRNFNREFASDTSAVIINKALLDLFNIADPETVINEYLQFGRNPDNEKFLIVGVVNDYNRSSLKNTVEPTVFFHDDTPDQTVIKLSGTGLASGIEKVQAIWSQFFPDAPFIYSFLDQRFEKLYQEDKKFGFIFFNFSLLAIFVASMGLFGLSSYLAVQRTKEVGIRKVLGASVSNIVLLFFRDFLWLIVIAIIIGIPFTYIGMTDWLNGYANRISFPWWVLSLAVLMVALLAFLTVSYQIWKLARLNPAKTIRYE